MLSKKRKQPPQAKPKPQKPYCPPYQQNLLKEVALLIRSRYGLIWLDTLEEERAESLLRLLASHLDLPFFIWSLNSGLYRDGYDKAIYGTNDPPTALDHIHHSKFPALYHVQGLGPFMEDPVLIAKLISISRTFADIPGSVILTGGDIQVSETLKPHLASVTFPAPSLEEYADLMQKIYRDLSKQMPLSVEMSKQDLNRLLTNMKGLTLIECEKIFTKALVEDGKLTPEDIKLVIEAKKSVIEREGLLEYYPAEKSLEDIADLKGLKGWLAKRKSIITAPDRAAEFGLVFPKGILLVGVPGTGKSLCAKAVAMEWGLPLLKMDPATLYNKYMGESEKNFKRAMSAAEKMAPVVLWIDEIEKAFSGMGGDQDAGTSQRILGTFLSWMQERKGDVFVVATSNDVSKLPPEFLRKGRFDEIFFVDLPNVEARTAIFQIHLTSRKQNPRQFDLPRLVQATEGFSGAEIEQVIVAALYTAFAENCQLETGVILKEVQSTSPLSQTRFEHIQQLRQWAQGRTASAQ